MKESIIKREILLELSKHPRIMLWNNPTAVARPRGSARYIRFGNPGEADLLGVVGPVSVDDGTLYDEYGHSLELYDELGLALAIETKTATGKLSPKQINWRDAFTAHGGIYILAHSVEDAKTQITIALRERGIEWEWIDQQTYPDSYPKESDTRH